MLRFPLIVALLMILAPTARSNDSLSYSGRLVNADGSPVTGPVNLQFQLSYTNAPAVFICSKTLPAVALTNGVFHVKLDYLAAECGGDSISKVLADTPVGESVAIKLTDTTHAKAYSLQALHSMPYAMMANMSRQLMQMGATAGQVLAWDGTKWAPAAAGGGGGSGTVTSIIAGTGLSGGTITTSGTIAIANLGVDTAQLANSAITDAKVSATAAIARTKLANGTADHVLINNGSGVMSSAAQLPIALGGTGAATAAAARTALGVAPIGTSAGSAMAADAAPNCLPTQKLQMSAGPTHLWSCVADALFDGGSVSAAIDMNSNKITELASPTVASDAANKAYVDAQISGVAVTQWTNVAGGHIKYTGGRVGVGVDPTEALDVAANAKVAGNVQIDGKLKLKSDNANFVELQAPAGVAATRTFVWPGVYGTNGQVLTTDGTGNLSWTTVSGGGGSNWTVTGAHVYRASGNVGIGTTTPAQNLQIVSADGDTGISISDTAANGIAEVTLGNDARTYSMAVSGSVNDIWGVYDNTASAWRLAITPSGDVGIGVTAPGSKLDVKGEFRLSGATSGHVGFVPPAVAGSQTYTLPNADGTSGQMLTTNGSGVLSWTTSAGGAVAVGGDLTGTVSNAQIAGDAVGSTEISNGAVGTTEIADTSVTYAKTNFADGDIPQAKVNGLVTALGTIAGKEPAITAGTTAQYWRGDKSWQTLNTTAVAEGTNLYFLDSRVRDALLAGYTTGSALPIAAGDTLLQALGKLEGSIAAVQAGGQWGLASGHVYRTTGRVGIGTSSPTTILDVSQADATPILSVRNTSSTTAQYPRIKIENFTDGFGGNPQFMLLNSRGNAGARGALASGDNMGSIEAWGGSSASTAGTGASVIFTAEDNFTSTSTPGRITFNTTASGSTSWTERMRINAAGNVGVGTTAPLAKFHVSGADASARVESTTEDHGLLLVKSGVQAFGFQVNGAANRLDITNANAGYPSTSRLMTVTSTGNVGIGTTSPLNNLTVSSASTNSTAIDIQNTAASGKTYSLYSSGGGPAAAGSFGIYDNTAALTRLFIDTAGNVGVGTTGLVGVGRTFEVSSASTAGTSIFLGNTDTGAKNWRVVSTGSANSGGAGNLLILNHTDDSTNARLAIKPNGNIGIGTTTPAGILDITSTTSGIVIPRMTTAQRDAIAAPLGGMQVYNSSTNQLNYHNGTSWQVLGTAGAGISSLTAGTGLTGGTITTSGTIAVDVGTGNSQIVQLNGSAQLPAVSGALLTNLNPANLSAAVPLTKGGTGLTAGGAANQVIGMNAAGTAAEYKTLSATTPLVLTHGVGTAALTLNTVQTASGGTGVTSFTGTRIIGSNAAGTGLVSLSCSVGEVLTFNVSGDYICQSVSSLVASGFIQNGNSFGATATLGTNDANDLAFETNGTTKMTILSDGKVGIGTVIPTVPLEVEATGLVTAKFVSSNANSRIRVTSTAPVSTSNISIIDFTANTSTNDRVTNSIQSGFSDTTDATRTSKMVFTGIQGGTGVNVMNLVGDKVGIGTATPEHPLHVPAGGRVGNILMTQGNAGMDMAYAYESIGSVAGTNLRLQSPLGVYFHTGMTATEADDDSKTRMVISSTGNVGIGTTVPSGTLHVVGSPVLFDKYAGVSNHRLRRANGTTTAPTAVQMNDTIGNYNFVGYATTGWAPAASATIRSVATENFTDSATGANMSFSTVPNGTSSQVERMRIEHNGNIGVGVTGPSAVLHLKAGTATADTAPLMFTAGTNLTTPQNGAMEFDGTNLYITTGGSRKTLSTSGGSSNYVSSGTISTSNATASTSTITGAVTVAGGVGIGGDLHVGSSTTVPAVYGSSAASGNLVLDSTSSSTKGSVLIGTALGSWVSMGSGTPSTRLDILGGFTSRRRSTPVFPGELVADSESFHTYVDDLAVNMFSEQNENNGTRGGFNFWMDNDGTQTPTFSIFKKSDTTTPLMRVLSNGNVGIGNVTPQTALHVGDGSGALAMTGTSPLAAILGASFSTGLVVRRTGHAEIGLQSGGGGGRVGTWSNHNMVFVTNATDQMLLDTAGFLGIGTAAPSQRLDVRGTFRLANTDFVAGTTGSFLDTNLGAASGNTYARLQGYTNGGANPATLALNPVSGSVGIGTVSPLGKLTVTSPGASTQVYIGDPAAGKTQGLLQTSADTNGSFQIQGVKTSGSAWGDVILNSSGGNVGIGTASPVTKFDVVGGRSTFAAVSEQYAVGAKYSSTGGAVYFGAVSNSATPDAAISNAGGATIATFTNSGRLGVGTTAPTAELDLASISPSVVLSETDSGSNAYTMQVNANTFTIGRYAAKAFAILGDNVGIGTTTPGTKLHIEHGGTFSPGSNALGGIIVGGSYGGGILMKDSTNYAGMWTSAGGAIMSFGSNGTAAGFGGAYGAMSIHGPNVGIGTMGSADERLVVMNGTTTGKYSTAGWTHVSDRRLKRDITPLKDPLERVLQLNGATFIFKEDKTNKKQLGLIAQDVEKVYPEVVLTDKNTGFKSVVYASLVAPLIDAVKVLNQKITGLFASDSKQNREIASLKAENAELKAYLCSKDPKAPMCKKK